MCSVVMDTDDGIMADYGLWDRTLMEVDLLEEKSYDDYFSRGAFESDPLLPFITSIISGGVGGNEDDAGQFLFSLPKDSSAGSSSENSDAARHLSDACHSELDLDNGHGYSAGPTTVSAEPQIPDALPSIQLSNIVIKTEPYDGLRSFWSTSTDGHNDSDNSSTTSGGNRSPPQNHNRNRGFVLPPTPPCSSDGESLPSPLSTPFRSPNASLSLATAISQSLTTAEDGSIMLTEEEKRTLIAEGYPIPARLPLTKAEERSLKRIRRKIKNKISAQESRRKKKEYIESLEKKVKNLNEDAAELRRRLETSESANRSLTEQLCKYQTLFKAKVQVTPVRRAVPAQVEKSS